MLTDCPGGGNLHFNIFFNIEATLFSCIFLKDNEKISMFTISEILTPLISDLYPLRGLQLLIDI